MKTLLCFSGQGSQFQGMGHSLYRGEPLYRKWVHRLCGAIPGHFIQYFEGTPPPSGTLWDNLAETHPLLFIVQAAYGLAWRESGRPIHGVFGYSLGEWVAAAVAGRVDPETAALIASEQAGVVLAQSPPAVMVALLGTPPHSWKDLSPSARNGPGRTVWVFPEGSWPSYQASLKEMRIPHQVLPVRRGFHSPLLAPARGGLLSLMSAVAFQCGDIPLFSATLGGPLAPDAGGAHFVEVLEDPIDMAQSLLAIDSAGPWHYIDAGPTGALAQMVKALLPGGSASTTRITQSPFGKHPHTLQPWPTDEHPISGPS